MRQHPPHRTTDAPAVLGTPRPTRSTEAPPALIHRPARLYTTEQVAEWLGLTTDEIKRMRGQGDGPPFRKLSPRVVRYDPRDVQAWLDAKVRTSTRPAKTPGN